MGRRKMNGAGYIATYDPEAKAVYVQISDAPVARTSQFHNVNIDLDDKGRVVGFEAL